MLSALRLSIITSFNPGSAVTDTVKAVAVLNKGEQHAKK
jgi:hypothetical protein